MARIPRGTSSNLLEDKKLAVSEQFELPVKDVFTADGAGSVALGEDERLKVKGGDDIVREVANLSDTMAIETVATYEDMLVMATGNRAIRIFVTDESQYNDAGGTDFFDYIPSKGIAYMGWLFNYTE